MPDSDLPADWPQLHAAAWAAGWSLSAGSAPGGGWTYAARRADDLRSAGYAQQWADAGAVAQWLAAGAPRPWPIQLELWPELRRAA